MCRHNNICLFSCIFVCKFNRVTSTGTFVHLVHIHIHFKDGMGVDICMRSISAHAYVHMQIYMFTGKPMYVFFKCQYMFTSMICNEPNSVETDIPPIMNNFQAVNFCLHQCWMVDDGHWMPYARHQKYFSAALKTCVPKCPPNVPKPLCPKVPPKNGWFCEMPPLIWMVSWNNLLQMTRDLYTLILGKAISQNALKNLKKAVL